MVEDFNIDDVLDGETLEESVELDILNCRSENALVAIGNLAEKEGIHLFVPGKRNPVYGNIDSIPVWDVEMLGAVSMSRVLNTIADKHGRAVEFKSIDNIFNSIKSWGANAICNYGGYFVLYKIPETTFEQTDADRLGY